MTNEEINLKLAAIEGWHANNSDYPSACWWFRGDEKHGGGPPPYATDWQWCGPLVEKYGVEVDWLGDDISKGAVWNARVYTRNHFNYYDTPDATWFEDEPTPQRAICLAVIAAQPTPATLPPEAPIHDSDRS